MINKKTIPVAVLLLLVVAAGALAAGASQTNQYQVPAGSVVLATGADQSQPVAQSLPAAPALPAATGQVLFTDSFSGQILKGWHNRADTVGQWKVLSSGVLQQDGSDSDGNMSDEDSVLVTDDAGFSNGTLEAQVFPTSGDPVGVVFRSTDAGYYRVWLAANLPNSKPKAYLQKVVNGQAQDIAVNTTWKGYEFAQWQNIQVVTSGNHITVSVGGTQLFDTTDSSFASGSVGVWTVASRGAKFDNVRVQAAGR
jgi:hypothetical protein